MLALSKVMDPVWATLVVAAVAGVGGFLIIRVSAAKLTPAELTPDRSTRQLGKDIDLVKGQTS